MVKRLSSLIKWAGGKEQELKYILPLLPAFQHYYEPFVGGGAVFFSVAASEKLINDRSSELVQFYRMVAQQDSRFQHTLDMLLEGWQLLSNVAELYATELVAYYVTFSMGVCERAELEQRLLAFLRTHQCEFCALFAPICEKNIENFLVELQRNLFNKMRRMHRLEQSKWSLPEHDIRANLESALKSAFYMHIRYLYNHREPFHIPCDQASALFFFMRENAYASMFRYNKQGKFNVPYGGITYNRKDLARKVTYMKSPEICAHFQNTIIENMDFEAFLLKYRPQHNDFIFLDPPYDSEFSTYAQNEFTLEDQRRLADYLIHRCQAQFMLVIKNTPVISSLYCNKGLNIISFDKKYIVSFQDRNKRDAEHLLITNFEKREAVLPEGITL